MPLIFPLFVIIFLEGYVVLSTELLAIRILMPFTGSGTDTVSIIIAAVLLPLACGYYAGGRFKSRRRDGKSPSTIRKKLIWNLVIAACILSIGLSYAFLDWSFVAVQKATGWHNRIFLTALYSTLFIVYPVFLLGQTVPLITNYFSRERFSMIAGRMLFFSTMGSFIGAVFSTLVLMAFLGVNYTVSVTIGCMAILVFLLSKKKVSLPTAIVTLGLVGTLILNGSGTMKRLNIVSNNQYSTVQIVDFEDDSLRAIKLNRSFASIIWTTTPETYVDYAIFIEDNFIAPIREEGSEKSILILGAGGFSIGRTDTKNKYTYVDIDKALKKISEDLFLEEKLTPNKEFVAMDARAYLVETEKKFDMILIDLCRDPISMPDNLVTREFFALTKSRLKESGVLLGNYWASPNFTDPYSRNLDATIRSVFPTINRQTVKNFNGWKREDDWNNVVYNYVHHPEQKLNIYTDDKNTAMYDRPVMLHQAKSSAN